MPEADSANVLDRYEVVQRQIVIRYSHTDEVTPYRAQAVCQAYGKFSELHRITLGAAWPPVSIMAPAPASSFILSPIQL